MTVFWQILIDGFAISSLYALGATGFALIFGVSGVLNLSHGALMVAAVVAAWAAGDSLHAGPYTGAAIGIAVGFSPRVADLFRRRSARCSTRGKSARRKRRSSSSRRRCFGAS